MEETETEVEAILERVREGDEQASAELLDYLYPLVRKIVWRRCPVEMSEEDLTQEVFIRIFKTLNQFSGKGRFRHWASRIAVNTCITHLIKCRRRRQELRKSDLPLEQQDILEHTVADERSEAPDRKVASLDLMETLLAFLPPKDRLILEMRELERKSFREIGLLTNLSEVNVRVRALRAKAKLRTYWKELQESEKR